jgi:hypothetical protein
VAPTETNAPPQKWKASVGCTEISIIIHAIAVAIIRFIFNYKVYDL